MDAGHVMPLEPVLQAFMLKELTEKTGIFFFFCQKRSKIVYWQMT